MSKNIEMSWDEINDIPQSKASLIGWNSSLPSIGDTKELVLHSGYKDITVTMQLVGINHDTIKSGETARFSFLCKNVFMKMQMKKDAKMSGGWMVSDIRKLLNKNIYNAMPANLQNMIKETIKPTYLGPTILESINTVNDKLWIPSNREVGLDDDGLADETDGTVYELFVNRKKTRESRIKKNDGGAQSTWWLRSVNKKNPTNFWCVYNGGHIGNSYATNKHGVVFGFCI